jgi:purine-nucleoside phosphorylase
MNPQYKPGDLMLIRNHINMPGLAGNNPLRGPNDEAVGPRFPDMTTPYDSELRELAHKVGNEAGIPLHEGVYVYVAGPSFETPAELHFLRMVGGDAVGMSTVPSVIVARHAGIRVLGVSTITNMALPDPASDTQHDHEDVLEAGESAVPRLARVVRGVVAGVR